MDAHDFSKPLKSKSDSPNVMSFCFGVDSKQTAIMLRLLADQLDQGTLAIAGARVQSLARDDEFPTTILRLKFFEMRPTTSYFVPKKDVSSYPVQAQEMAQLTRLPIEPIPPDFMDSVDYYTSVLAQRGK